MTQVRNTFVKSKMNKDLDARLLPNGEYREGRNINVSKSEGADVGALENVLGNTAVGNLSGWISKNVTGVSGDPAHLEIIGMFPDPSTNALYVFATNFTDSSPNSLDCNAVRAGTSTPYTTHSNAHWIFQLLVDVDGNIVTIPLVTGSFLNFSKTHKITGCDVLEGLLFWTDNRNQPRKINIENAKSSLPLPVPTYYTTEDQISVAKYYPYQGIDFVKKIGSDYISTLVDENSEYLPPSLVAGINSISGSNLLFSGTTPQGVEWDNTADITGFITKTTITGKKIKVTNFSQPDEDPLMVVNVVGNVVTLGEVPNIPIDPILLAGWNRGDIVVFQLGNPDYKSDFSGDKDFLKEKFARFSYRFQYDDNEYSLMAPFTQPAFLPKQYGSIGVGDENNTKMETILNFFENTITTVGLVITLPEDYDEIKNKLKIKNLEILIKTSDNPNVQIVKELPIEQIEDGSYTPNVSLKKQLVYEYRSNKPWKTLPEKDILRVNDIIPTRALAQASSGNRIIYGNFTNEPTSPESLNYEILANDKVGTALVPLATTETNLIKEYYNHTLKQGRSYQVGVVLSDRYGRQSNVILAKNDALAITSTYSGSSTYAGFTNGGADPLEWFGNSLKINWIDGIPESIISAPGYPGLYNASTNPLGWYSYKIVVKQQEQEYYNIYLAGAVSGDIIYKNPRTPLSYGDTTKRSKVALFGDNINKIPRDLDNTGPVDTVFGSNVKLVGRVIQNVYDSENIENTIQTSSLGKWGNVISIEPFRDLGDWTKYKGVITYDGAGTADGAYVYPGSNPTGGGTIGVTDPFINTDNNPYIATINTTGVKATGEDRVGFEAGEYDSIGGTVDGQVGGTFAKKLMVFETKPFESKLDIYWETTTSGLISTLNQQVKLEVGALDLYGLSDFIFTQSESFVFGSDVLGATLVPTNRAGTILTDPNCTMTLLGVYAGTGHNINTAVNLKDRYEVYIKVVGTPPQFMIRTKGSAPGEDFEYLNRPHLETYSFHLQVDQVAPTAISKTFIFNNNRLTNYKPEYWGNNPNAFPGVSWDNYTKFIESSNHGERLWKGLIFDNQGYGHFAIPDTDSINDININSRIEADGVGGSCRLNQFSNGSAKESAAYTQIYVSKVEWYKEDGTYGGLVDEWNGFNFPQNQTYTLTDINDTSLAMGGHYFTGKNPNNPHPIMIPGPGTANTNRQPFPFVINYYQNEGYVLETNPYYPPSYNVQPWSRPLPIAVHTAGSQWVVEGGSKRSASAISGAVVPIGQKYLTFKIFIGLTETFPGGIDDPEALTLAYKLYK